MQNKQVRVRCSDEQFLQAVYSSQTYAEIASKTGQKIASTVARYSRIRRVLSKEGIELPKIERKKSTRNLDSIKNMVTIVKRLKEHHSNM